jgi:hypothetical protein
VNVFYCMVGKVEARSGRIKELRRTWTNSRPPSVRRRRRRKNASRNGLAKTQSCLKTVLRRMLIKERKRRAAALRASDEVCQKASFGPSTTLVHDSKPTGMNKRSCLVKILVLEGTKKTKDYAKGVTFNHYERTGVTSKGLFTGAFSIVRSTNQHFSDRLVLLPQTKHLRRY